MYMRKDELHTYTCIVRYQTTFIVHIKSMLLGSEEVIFMGFLWEPYGDKMNYTNFAPGEPNDHHHNEDCLLLDTTLHWSDRNCDDTHFYICKKM